MSIGRIPVTVIEIDQDRCEHVFGESPCTATGEPCYNTRATCKDVPNYSLGDPLTLRFSMRDRSETFGEYVIPSVESVSTTPTRINLGGRSGKSKPLGIRAQASLTLRDHPHSDLLVDPYLDQRTYDPLERSTFWAKWLVRNPFFEGRALRVSEGYADQAIGDMLTRHYVLDKIDGPDSSGRVSIRALDILRLADDSKAQAPRLSTGQLVVALDESDTTIIISGALEADYSWSGVIRIGEELMTYGGISTIGGGNVQLTSVGRAAYNTTVKTHTEGDTVQAVLFIDRLNLWDVAYDLLVNYANVNPGYVDLDAWELESVRWLASFPVSRVIAEPTGVTQLLGELSEQCAVYFWWDEIAQQIKLRAIAPTIAQTVPLITDTNNIVAGSTRITTEPDLRISEVWVNFLPSVPSERRDEQSRFRRTRVRIDADAASPEQYGDRRVYEVFARWLVGDAQATTLSSRLIETYKDPPKTITLELDTKDRDIATVGSEIDISYRGFVDASGAAQPVRYRIVSSHESPPGEKIVIEAQKSIFGIDKKYGLLAPDTVPTYLDATEEQKAKYVFLAGPSGTMSNGDDPYQLV